MFFIAALALATLFLLHRRALRYLRYLQQEDYDPQRFLKWYVANGAFDRRVTLVAFAAFALSYWSFPLAVTLFSAVALFIVWFEKDPRKEGKLPLKMTKRATRMHAVHLSLALMLLGVSLVWQDFWISLAVVIQALGPLIALAAWLLAPDERRRQAIWVKQAQEKLAAVQPFIIGITGSYGKTSTKKALGELLQVTLGPTFWPQKGINTDMGNTRAIREGLKKGTQYLLLEMGAYKEGSIARQCALFSPDAAIITAVGHCHLERYGSYEKIYKTKAAMAEALKEGGVLVCCGDNEGARAIANAHRQSKKVFLYGASGDDLDCKITCSNMTEKGIAFTLLWKGKEYSGTLPQWGSHSLLNAAGAFTMAVALGADPAFVAAALTQLKPESNRLEVEKDAQGYLLRDAYNSNPVGFQSALEVLGALPSSERLLMTPGMIELGSFQHQENYRLALQAAKVCDRVLLVGNTNATSLSQGLQDGGLAKEHIYFCATREEAFACLAKIRKEKSALLIENDLPDLYEAKERF